MKKALIVPALLLLIGVAAVSHEQTLSLAQQVSSEELGRMLFWDPVLSGERDVACATCHHPDLAYADGRALSRGVGSVGLGPDRIDRSDGRVPPVRRNSQTVLNTVLNGQRRFRGRRDRRGGGAQADGQARAPMFWDSRVQSLETQALEPIKSFEEMRGDAYAEDEAVDSVLERLRAVPEYRSHFEEAFGVGTPIDADHLSKALADFQRGLVAMDSRWDRFRAGDSTALTQTEQRGMRAFDRVGCDRCHRGSAFSDFSRHAEGVAEHPLLATPDTSQGRFRFRTPTLRNVALTAPYMHNGTLATLEDVLRFYDEGRSRNPSVVNGGRRGGGSDGPTLSRDFRRVRDMSDQEISDIVAFLGALTDEDFDRTIPARVPSGLPPGGSIQGR